MGEADIGQLLHQAVTVVTKLGGPPLLAALAVGLVMSLVQAVTQIHEQTVAFVPKMAAVVGVMLVLGPYMYNTLADFSQVLFDRLVAIGGA